MTAESKTKTKTKTKTATSEIADKQKSWLYSCDRAKDRHRGNEGATGPKPEEAVGAQE
jgi:hypothetical protein